MADFFEMLLCKDKRYQTALRYYKLFLSLVGRFLIYRLD